MGSLKKNPGNNILEPTTQYSPSLWMLTFDLLTSFDLLTLFQSLKMQQMKKLRRFRFFLRKKYKKFCVLSLFFIEQKNNR